MSSSSSTILDAPPIIGHTSLSKEQRPRVSKKLRKLAKDLEQALLFLQDKYAKEEELSSILQTAIKSSRDLSESSRKSDRDAVFLLLDGWAAMTLEEICDDTGLSRWVVGAILDEFIGHGLVAAHPQYDPKPSQGSCPLIYSLTHSSVLK